MAQEEHSHSQQGNSNSSGGSSLGNFGKSSRKHQKQKKVPQRGLGVAQLERIRIEEQRKKEAAMATTSTLSSPPSISQASVTSVNPPQSDGLDVGVLPGSILMHGNSTKMWKSGDVGAEFDNPCTKSTIMLRSSNWRIPRDSDAMFPIPPPIQRIPQFSHPPLMNAPPVTSSSSTTTSIRNFKMEPPSNQNYHSNCIPITSEIEKVVGMKRPCPFPQENPPAPPLRSTITHPIHRFNELSSRGNGSRYNFELRSGNLREVISCSTRLPESDSSKSPRGSGILGEVLTLATPSTTSTWKNPKFIEPPAPLAYRNYNFHDPMPLPHQGYDEQPSFQLVSNRMDRQQQYYTFLPLPKPKEGQENSSFKTSNAESGECIDLNLKL